MGKSRLTYMQAGASLALAGWALAWYFLNDMYSDDISNATLYGLFVAIVLAGVSIIGVATFMKGFFLPKEG